MFPSLNFCQSLNHSSVFSLERGGHYVAQYPSQLLFSSLNLPICGDNVQKPPTCGPYQGGWGAGNYQ